MSDNSLAIIVLAVAVLLLQLQIIILMRRPGPIGFTGAAGRDGKDYYGPGAA